ncbi:1331_t:CDS:10 [Entrophospora sp. SA101]|nr:10768_t:CDS:10 [Entrophospora sp. SA101]CAJ0761868.1 8727_t:CDS:10 [Entrophospora sp. SA101]CAJ0768907.1 1331_t:CDS:10 [Entrophospora sp. SA101]
MSNILGKRYKDSYLERNINWMIRSNDPTPLEFFRFIFPKQRNMAFVKYHETLYESLNYAEDQAVKEKLEKIKKNLSEETIQKDWITWTEERKAVEIRHSIIQTNVNIQGKFNSLVQKEDIKTLDSEFEKRISDDEGEESHDEEDVEANPIKKIKSIVAATTPSSSQIETRTRITVLEEDAAEKGVDRIDRNNEEICTSDINYSADESDWMLSTGTNVSEKLRTYSRKIPAKEAFLHPAYFGIVDLSGEDIGFKKIFTEIEWSEMIQDLKTMLSEGYFSSSFTNMLTKGILTYEHGLSYDEGETQSLASTLIKNLDQDPTSRSIIGQKCDCRVHKGGFEYVIGLRSGGLPEAAKSKKWGDKVDLAVAMRDVLLKEGLENNGVDTENFRKIFTLGMHSYGYKYNVYGIDWKAKNLWRFGLLQETKLPQIINQLPMIEKTITLLLRVEKTISVAEKIRNRVTFEKARLYRNRRDSGYCMPYSICTVGRTSRTRTDMTLLAMNLGF